jgi:hypothetical protein
LKQKPADLQQKILFVSIVFVSLHWNSQFWFLQDFKTYIILIHIGLNKCIWILCTSWRSQTYDSITPVRIYLITCIS